MRAKCNDDLSTVNFSTIGLDVHKNRLVACAVHRCNCIDAKAVKKMTENQQAHRPGTKGSCAPTFYIYYTLAYLM